MSRSQGEQYSNNSIQRSSRPDHATFSKRRRLDYNLHADALRSFSSSSLAPVRNTNRTLARPFRVSHAFRTISAPNLNRYTYAHAPPKTLELLETLGDDIPNKIYQLPYYSRACDISERSHEYAGLLYHLQGQDTCALEEWDDFSRLQETMLYTSDFDPAEAAGWEYASCPPSIKEVSIWLISQGGGLHANVQLPNPRSQVRR